MLNDELEGLFTYHPPHEGQLTRYLAIRSSALVFAKLINELCPDSREKSLAITRLQECVQMANASIAIHEEVPV